MAFGERGSALFEALKAKFADDPAGLELLIEACRLADRLDALDEVIAGKGVISLLHFRHMLSSGDGSEDDPIRVELHFDKVLAESRQQQNTFRLLLQQIVPSEAPAVPADDDGEQKPGVPSVADIRARRAARSGGSAPTG